MILRKLNLDFHNYNLNLTLMNLRSLHRMDYVQHVLVIWLCTFINTLFIVFFCTNKREEGHPRGCCAEKSSLKLRNIMKIKTKELGLKDIRINAAGCLDKCEFRPTIVVYPEGIWYSIKNEQDIEEIINSHLIAGKPVEKLFAFK